MPERLWEYAPGRKKEREVAGPAKKLFTTMIDEAKEESKRSGDEHNTLISLLLGVAEKEKHLPEEERLYPLSDMIGECFSFFGAGADTTANTLGLN